MLSRHNILYGKVNRDDFQYVQQIEEMILSFRDMEVNMEQKGGYRMFRQLEIKKSEALTSDRINLDIKLDVE